MGRTVNSTTFDFVRDTIRRLSRRWLVIFPVVVCMLLYILFERSILSATSERAHLFINLRNFSQKGKTRNLIWHNRAPKRLVHDVNCDAIIKGNKDEVERAKTLMSAKYFARNIVSDSDYIMLTKNCNDFKRLRYPQYILSSEEADMSVAYSILLYKDVEQAERLLRAIYSPKNYYCLHVDADSKREVHDAIQGIADCFDNVFVVSRKEHIVYGGFTRLQADLNCMENLLQRNTDWKYFINLPGQQFPLKTNAEISKILKSYNGANDIQSVTGSKSHPQRYKFRFGYKQMENSVKPIIFSTNRTKDKPPYNSTVAKGSAYGIFSRDFVQFVTYNKTAKVLLDWFRDTYSPDEHYWATLNYNRHLGTPGSFNKGKSEDKPFLAVFVVWKKGGQCEGKYVRSICIFGVGDLHVLTKVPYLFANKFHIDYQPYALECMEEWHYNRSARGIQDLNVTYYESLPFINHNGSS